MEKETLKKAIEINEIIESTNKKLDLLRDSEFRCVSIALDYENSRSTKECEITEIELLDKLSEVIRTYYKNKKEEQERRLAEL